MQNPAKKRIRHKGRSETQLVGACLLVLHLHKVFAWRNNTGGFKKNGHFYRFGLVGSSDILGVLPEGRFLAVECKRPGNRPTPAQDDFLKQVREKGGLALVVYEAQELNEWLQGYSKNNRPPVNPNPDAKNVVSWG